MAVLIKPGVMPKVFSRAQALELTVDAPLLHDVAMMSETSCSVVKICQPMEAVIWWWRKEDAKRMI
ncbi:hypothetical protein FH972_022348 [Carpinus fangiana]|uniref:Uncharacterized protein n=1 Tax=Carpinus fangiana TaxID=176857 RepID=A0A5N6KSC7_9ROSI|nr:hypothetical protein FH972_022348 [Carpinus fangiana]